MRRHLRVPDQPSSWGSMEFCNTRLGVWVRDGAAAGAPQVPECPEHVQAWVAEMAAFAKRVDPNHLVTIGEEGFFASDRAEVCFWAGTGMGNHKCPQRSSAAGMPCKRHHELLGICWLQALNH